MRSILKWPGGKNKISNKILNMFPQQINTYFEPFVGGASIFFNACEEKLIKKAIISDINKELISFYQFLKENNINILIKELKKFKNEKEFYYNIRKIDRTSEFKKYNELSKTARFLYLNKTCFNGLYRVNKKNQFNVPFGNYKNPNFLDENRLKKCKKYLEMSEIKSGNFLHIKKNIKNGDFVYFDPPYLPFNNKKMFTEYQSKKFDFEQHLLLKDLCDYLDNKDIKFILSNSYTNRTFEMYKKYNIEIIEVYKSISSKSNKRKNTKEILVKNF